MADNKQVSSSTSAFVSALILYGIIAIVMVIAFVSLRAKQRRTYEPRSLEDIATIKEEEKTESVPSGAGAWITYLLSKPNSFLMQHCSLDGYLFLRYIGIFGALSFLGCLILFPILLPVNATNGHNLKGFELLSISNVVNKNRAFAHVFLSWVFFGMVMFVIYKELVYYVSLRHAVQTTPLYDGLVSSRTVILTDLKDGLDSEAEMRKHFPNAQKVFVARNHKELQEMVSERTKLANKVEGAYNSVLNKSVKKKLKDEKKDKLLNGSDLETYIPQKKRPTHRNGKIPLPCFGEKVDTIDWGTKRLGQLNDKIATKQENYENDPTVGTCIILFENQLDAQSAYQSVPYLFKKSYDQCLIGYSPDDLVWENLSVSKHARMVKRLGANTILTLMIIFWAIPVAVVGFISNINNLTNTLHFLKFINNLPHFLLGLITSLLPTVALAILMSLVPPFIKFVGKKGGCLTIQEQELYCQTWYYGFQVVQVFLMTTVTSSASAVVGSIIDKPSSAMTLLGQNLPLAANFYIAYFLLQGLTVPAGNLLQIVALLLNNILGRVLDSTPRQKWNRYNGLGSPSWGVVYPPFQLFIVIYLAYSIISPLILVFSTVCLCFMYIAYIYNLAYVQGFSFDMRGRNYPKALLQTFVGLYLAEICILAIFVMKKSWACVVLEAVCIAVTVAVHLYCKWRFIPLFDAVPLSAIKIARGNIEVQYPQKDQGLKEIKETGKSGSANFDSTGTGGAIQPATAHDLQGVSVVDDEPVSKPVANTFASEESFTKISTSSNQGRQAPSEGDKESAGDTNITHKTEDADVFGDKHAINHDEKAYPPNYTIASRGDFKQRFLLFFRPSVVYAFEAVRCTLPYVYNTVVSYTPDYVETCYSDPAVRDQAPVIWIAKDKMGISDSEIEKVQSKNINLTITNENTEYNEKGKSQYLANPPDYELEAKK